MSREFHIVHKDLDAFLLAQHKRVDELMAKWKQEFLDLSSLPAVPEASVDRIKDDIEDAFDRYSHGYLLKLDYDNFCTPLGVSTSSAFHFCDLFASGKLDAVKKYLEQDPNLVIKDEYDQEFTYEQFVAYVNS